jgi:hypothetical protein
VIRAADTAGDGSRAGVPLLVVEVLSPGSVRIDRIARRACYARMRVPSDWITYPRIGPTVTVPRYDPTIDGREVPETGTKGVVSVTGPFAVTFRPAELPD